ncbi:MAG: IPT/TIG domain-containing protein [Fimbriimonadaceae bacterium]
MNDYLVLTGEFGSEPGRVLVNNVPATVVGTWGSSTLLTRIPASGNGSEGPVVVEVHDKKSKPRYLTSWRGTYTYNYVDPSLRSTLTESATVNIHIRADIDVYRQNPGEVPQDQPFRSFFAAADSSLNWACSGTLVDAQNVVIVRWTGGGNPPHSFSSPTTPSAKWICSGAFDPVMRRLTLSVFNGGPKSEFKFGEGTQMIFPQSSSAYDKILNADWSGPALDLSSPNTTSKWSAFAVSSVPPMAGYYSPRD